MVYIKVDKNHDLKKNQKNRSF